MKNNKNLDFEQLTVLAFLWTWSPAVRFVVLRATWLMTRRTCKAEMKTQHHLQAPKLLTYYSPKKQLRIRGWWGKTQLKQEKNDDSEDDDDAAVTATKPFTLTSDVCPSNGTAQLSSWRLLSSDVIHDPSYSQWFWRNVSLSPCLYYIVWCHPFVSVHPSRITLDIPEQPTLLNYYIIIYNSNLWHNQSSIAKQPKL